MNIKTKVAYLLVSGTIALSAVSTIAAGNDPLQIDMSAYAITLDANGREVATKTVDVDPSQTVEFRASYKNITASPLSGVVVTGPIPASTQYQPNTAKSPVAADFEVSIDAGKTFEGEPVTRMVKNEAGKLVEVTIPASKYTHVRWVPKSQIPGNAEQVYSYRVKVK